MTYGDIHDKTILTTVDAYVDTLRSQSTTTSVLAVAEPPLLLTTDVATCTSLCQGRGVAGGIQQLGGMMQGMAGGHTTLLTPRRRTR